MERDPCSFSVSEREDVVHENLSRALAHLQAAARNLPKIAAYDAMKLMGVAVENGLKGMIEVWRLRRQ